MSELDPDAKDLFLFVHIPKTAGTSLRSMFMEHMELNKDFIHLGPAGYRNDESLGLKPFAQRAYHDRSLARVILGHDVDKDTYKLVPGKRPKYAVFLRNPAARIVSLYNYEMHTVYSKKGKPVIEFDEWYLKQEKNNMTKLLAKRILNGTSKRTWFHTTRLLERHTPFRISDNLLEKVNQELEKFWFVGCTEHMDRDIPLIAQRIGIPGSLQRSNVSGKDFNRLIRLDEALEKRINADNIIDTNLFQYWQNKLHEGTKELA